MTQSETWNRSRIGYQLETDILRRYSKRNSRSKLHKKISVQGEARWIALKGSLITASISWAGTLPTHRIPAARAVEAANERSRLAPDRATVKLQLCSTHTSCFSVAWR